MRLKPIRIGLGQRKVLRYSIRYRRIPIPIPIQIRMQIQSVLAVQGINSFLRSANATALIVQLAA